MGAETEHLSSLNCAGIDSESWCAISSAHWGWDNQPGSWDCALLAGVHTSRSQRWEGRSSVPRCPASQPSANTHFLPSKLMDVKELFPVPSLTASWLYSSPSWKSFTLGLPRDLSGSPSSPSLVCEWVISNIVLRFFYIVPSTAHLRSHLGEHLVEWHMLLPLSCQEFLTFFFIKNPIGKLLGKICEVEQS